MGTLGCINDMMRRDKENRELRKAGKERLNETRNRLIDLNKKGHSSHLSLLIAGVLIWIGITFL